MKTRQEAYLYHVNFNAMHNLSPEDPRKMHAHTFRVGMYVTRETNEQAVFLNIEQFLYDYFETYRGIRLNELQVFKDRIPTLEAMGDHFFDELKERFSRRGMRLLTLEIGDSPVSRYCVGGQLLLGDVYNRVKQEMVEAYCRRVRGKYKDVYQKNGEKLKTGEEKQ